MSRPTLSVPNQCAAEGGRSTINGCVADPASPGNGASTGAKTATRTMTRDMTAPATSSGLARSPRRSRSPRGMVLPWTGRVVGASIIAAGSWGR